MHLPYNVWILDTSRQLVIARMVDLRKERHAMKSCNMMTVNQKSSGTTWMFMRIGLMSLRCRSLLKLSVEWLF